MCGVGFLARVDGQPSRAIVADGLLALNRVAHRGASDALGPIPREGAPGLSVPGGAPGLSVPGGAPGLSIDGCGLMTAIPWRLLEGACDRLPVGVCRAAGMLFVADGHHGATIDIVERELRVAGAIDFVWRRVPTDTSVVPPAQRATAPVVLQVLAAFDADERVAARGVYRARLRIERAAADRGVAVDVVSLSTRTIVYKALAAPSALDAFYPDLADGDFESPFVTFHQRYSTNTSANWALAQPFRTLAHNGEINTIAGNRSWMRARVADRTSMPGMDGERPISEHGSDSRSLDDAVELLRYRGDSLAHALSRLVPPAWERDDELPPEVRAFYEFQSLMSEPWDGPAALIFSDGRHVGAAMDRNGFRPARIVTTRGGVVALASEVGILSDEHEIVDRGRLGPGEMLIVDMQRRRVSRTAQIRRALARRRPYARLVAAATRELRPVAPSSASWLKTTAAVGEAQLIFGCTREEIDVILKPMVADGREAVGSMGDDTPPAVLSARPRLFTDFFRQRFAQVTNPPVDPYRESAVMSLTSVLGAHGDYFEEALPRPLRLVLRSPIVDDGELGAIAGAAGVASAVVDTTIDAAITANAGDLFESRLETIVAEACDAVERGSAIVILSDRAAGRERAPVPALLVTSAVHHGLIARGLRLRASIVVDTGDARDAHQLSALCAFGASAVCPRLGFATAASLAGRLDDEDAVCRERYRGALQHGLLTIMSKMGVCTFSGYCGAALFEILGLDGSIASRFFAGTASPVGGVGLAAVASAVLDRHRGAFAAAAALDYPGLHGYRRGGEYHATNPLVVRSLQRARDGQAARAGQAGRAGQDGREGYAQFVGHVYGRPPAAIRDFLEFARSTETAERGEAIEDVSSIVRRFFASAMSIGALSPEAHSTLAIAMNRLGARSNSGEGGEEPRNADASSRTKQVASARFGVTPAYLRSADELQIKIAQGSKPGEGGQLPAIKVVAHIARLRHAQPGTTLISPPVHHDIYSIEDLAQLIFDLRAFHPSARISVKLVASTGVGIIAVGVAKAGADAIQISGHDGGTGASPRGSIKHAGMPWEIGLAEAHRALVAAGLRHRVVLQTDGGLKTGRDIAIAAALGADEYGFGTAALVAIGCVMARQCHANTCPVGIATQRDDLRAGFSGTPDMLAGYLRLVAQEVREILARTGVERMSDLIGRADLLRVREGATPPIDLSPLLAGTGGAGKAGKAGEAGGKALFPPASRPALPAPPALPARVIANTDRAFGAAIAGAIAERFGDAGLPEGSVQMMLTGSAGQSFGAFALPGMRLVLTGDANDGVGKGMHGGEIVVAPKARERGRTGQALIGNSALYGATGGRLFVAGAAGERFAVRNSGATAVVEGVGNHGCEYMTGGTVLVLGPTGRNFAAGLTGGTVFVLGAREAVAARSSRTEVAIESLTPGDHVIVRDLLEQHARLTGSRVARALLRNDPTLSSFCRVVPATRVAAAAAEADVAAAAV